MPLRVSVQSGPRLAKKRFKSGKKRVRKNLRAFGGGMNAVGLDGARNVNQVLVDHGHKGDMRARGRLAKDVIERVNVIRTVIGRQRDAGQKHADVRMKQGGQHLVEILCGDSKWQPAQAIVAAKLDDDHGWMQAQNLRKPLDGILGCGAAGAEVHHLVGIAQLVQVTPQRVRIRLAGSESVARRNAVSKADKDRPGLRNCTKRKQNRQNGNKN